MTNASYTERTAVISVALANWKERSLINRRSIFVDGAGGEDVWTTKCTQELIDRFVNSPDESSRRFIEKLQDQLAEASKSTVQLLTELSWLYLLASMTLRPTTKRGVLSSVAAIAGASLPEGVYDDALESGLASTGTSYNTHRPFQLWFLIRFAHEWLLLDTEAHKKLLVDPWAFRKMVYAIEGSADAAMRHAICFYVHPKTFEPILSNRMKIKIVAGLKQAGDSDESFDHTLLAIHQRVKEEFGADATLWDQKVRVLWDEAIPPYVGEETGEINSDANDQGRETGETTAGFDPESLLDKQERRAWFIRGSSGERVPEWLDLGRCALYSEDLFPFPIEPGETRQAIRDKSDAAGVDITAPGFNHALGQMWRFVNEMELGDYVLTVRGQDIYLGVVETEARTVGARARQQTYRDVEWLNASKPIKRRDVSPEVYSKLKTLLTLSHISSVLNRLDEWVHHNFDTSTLFYKAIEGPLVENLVLPQPSSELASDLLVQSNWLAEQVALLRNKRQLIYYGPPGTGKTFLALKLAEDLIREGGEVELVQFHPSYTYEDFFEGYRPVASSGGQVTFEIRHGPLRRLADMAEQAPSKPHFLLIDEINRANLAKVFGELYFLLEYRQRNITLQYSEDEFSLPDNLFVIGTMNTADRSIALIDAAMRRRFYFVEMSPEKKPVEGLLRRWLAANKLSDNAANLLDALNERISDSDASVGPTYLMQDDIDEKGCLDRVWQYGIMPLLEERYQGLDDGRLDDFSLVALRRLIDKKHQS